MNFLLFLFIIGVVYFFLQKKNLNTLSTIDKERLVYFDKKYQRQLANVNTSFDRIQELTKLTFDLLNIHLIKLLMEENPKRYDAIAAKHKAGKLKTDEYAEWIDESNKPKITKLRNSKKILAECNSIFSQIFQLWEKAINKHIKNNTEQELEFYLDDLQGACIYFDAFHSAISKEKILVDNKSLELKKMLEHLYKQLNEILGDSQKRFFES